MNASNLSTNPSSLCIPPTPNGLFNNLAREHGFESIAITGALPKSLQGTLYRNGIGIFEQFGRRYDHIPKTFEISGLCHALFIP